MAEGGGGQGEVEGKGYMNKNVSLFIIFFGDFKCETKKCFYFFLLQQMKAHRRGGGTVRGGVLGGHPGAAGNYAGPGDAEEGHSQRGRQQGTEVLQIRRSQGLRRGDDALRHHAGEPQPHRHPH